jgi:hypothetical protein
VIVTYWRIGASNSYTASLFANTKALFHVPSNEKQTTERCLMIDLAATREADAHRVVTNVGLIRSELNLGDWMSKRCPSRASKNLYLIFHLNHLVGKIILR